MDEPVGPRPGSPQHTGDRSGVRPRFSAAKDARVHASKVLKGPTAKFTGDRKAFIVAVRDALYASKICSYAQGFVQMAAAAKEHDWPLKFGDIALLWRGGCIIRARFLDRIKEAFDADPNLENLLLAPYFQAEVNGPRRPGGKSLPRR